MITVPFFTAMLALSTGVFGAYIPEHQLETRNLAALSRQAVVKIAGTVTKGSFRKVGQVFAGGLGFGKIATPFVAKAFAGGTVAAGAQVATLASEDKKRDLDGLEARNGPLLRAVQGMSRVVPQRFRATNLVHRGKQVAAGGTLAFIAGVGEAHGGQAAERSTARLALANQREAALAGGKRDLEERSFGLEGRDMDEELWARHPGFRAALNPGTVNALKTAATSVMAGVAAYNGGRVEGWGQGTPPEVFGQIKSAPLSTFKKLAPPMKLPALKIPFIGGASGNKRREYVEELVARALFEFMLEDDMQ
ncbi:hypothetical protein Hypma_008585 [Hypsizygus marmoreus]|uniref:Uncharacterized protein n=1 Tax=Hypsizygus marmoreus TaxID=39966 RepID=A0A369JWN8_HYPMA|nr:hypothetical protein Hypma_008585 [Hypsizygus marmoreus]